MSVRLRLALTVLATGLASAIGVIVAVGLAFERFEREAAYARADAFLGRVVALHDDLIAQQRRAPEAFTQFLRSLLLFEPDSQLYLLDREGTVLASSGSRPPGDGLRVAIAPVREAAAAAAMPGRRGAAYVMGDDPEHMEMDAVIAARALRPATIRADAPDAGYLYVVCRKPGLPPSRLARFAASLAGPALGPVLAVIVVATLLAAWIIAAVTRPLAVLSRDVARAAERGFADDTALTASPAAPAAGDDEFGRLRRGFAALLDTLRRQWDELRRQDAFRRESVSNLSHDLRSPLTAAVAGLETLQQRLAGDAARADERALVEVALRNTHNAARLVRSLGDLAVLDEAGFRLRPAQLDLAEVLDDIVRRFADRAAAQGVALAFRPASPEPLAASVDVELFERAIANLLDNALRFTPAGGRIAIDASAGDDGDVRVDVADSGCGIAAADLPHLFHRHYQGGGGARGPQGERAERGKGLGLAIVQRIVELHGGRVEVASAPGAGTRVSIVLPAASGRAGVATA